MPKSTEVLPECTQLMDAGKLRPFVEAFTSQLLNLGHTRLTVSGYEASVRHFGQWLQSTKIAITEIDDDVVRRFAQHRCRCPGSRQTDLLSAKYVNRVRRFVGFLVEYGAVTPPTHELPGVDHHEVQIAAFQTWLRRHRGISERTVHRHGRMVTRLLAGLGRDPKLYDARLVRQVVLDEAQRSSRANLKTMTMALRGYLKYLATQSLCQPGLDQAIPTVPQWRLSALPLYISTADVDRVVASCDVTTPVGMRDHAVLLLLARLGLRAGDVSSMCLEDIDWREGTLCVRGKGRREIRLPLPQDVGEAIIDYLREARPRAAYEEIFLRAVAPHRPLASATVSSIVKLALVRTGIDNAPSRGANLLRHSAATSMLRAGATLDMIGTVLRHRSVDTTAHYAKVDINMLLQIAQPWPGSASC
ncbi:tyrosine-type recombinase/integrase [Rhizobium leguminosarum]|uniref:tyrosine-type recombinase/integrase n=1 Tax=Rhizobium leguminosarum TaxID=384 RepID=UPI0014429FB7|nr:tyrosine-type recombinase/integrase [Rhizobium leguminosarum]NKL66982.1 tyrosine-type recombinase/integrase [Rhizobium leguminosarum bv. viciae]